MTIHHSIAKQAAKLGITLAEVDGAFTATLTDGTVHTAKSAKDAMALATGKPARAPKAAKGKQPSKKFKKAKADEDEEDGEEKESKSVVPAKYRAKYKPHKDTCGDAWVQKMFVFLHPDGEDLDLNRFRQLAKDNEVDASKWAHLKNRDGGPNVGMWRMNLGNVLRARFRQGKTVKIGNERLVNEEAKTEAK